MTVISIQSQVAFGHVGNSAAVFPMQMHGIDVIAVPTTLLSNRPGYKTIRGRVCTTSAELAALILDESEVAVVPGEAFGPSGYLRLSYALSDADLAEGVARIQKLLGEAE